MSRSYGFDSDYDFLMTWIIIEVAGSSHEIENVVKVKTLAHQTIVSGNWLIISYVYEVEVEVDTRSMQQLV